MRKIILKLTTLLIAFLVIFSFSKFNIALAELKESKSIIVLPNEALIWVRTDKIHCEYKYELYKRDYSSKTIEDTINVKEEVFARTSGEAVNIVKAKLSGECPNLKATVEAGSSVIINGEVYYKYTVTGTRIERYIQYYDQYREYEYSYYIGELRGTSGRVYETDPFYSFIKKTLTNAEPKLVAGRTEHV
ncbi:MAG: hypothetical protein N2448_07450 [Caloramator sp.]|nr:hypothetical protein [Caloramator sp.]